MIVDRFGAQPQATTTNRRSFFRLSKPNAAALNGAPSGTLFLSRFSARLRFHCMTLGQLAIVCKPLSHYGFQVKAIQARVLWSSSNLELHLSWKQVICTMFWLMKSVSLSLCSSISKIYFKLQAIPEGHGRLSTIENSRPGRCTATSTRERFIY